MSPVRAWWVLARPAGLWIPPLLPLLGYGWAHWDRALVAYRPLALPSVLLAWMVLQAGTLWLNAARDRDTGEVLLGRAVPVPPGTARLGLVALAASTGLAALSGPAPAACAALASGLAILYSHPAIAWKGHPVLGPAVNAVGYGLLSPLAGYAIVGTWPTWRTLATVGLLISATLGWTFISQAFQADEDRARGDRTLVATRGPRAALGAGRVGLGLSGIGLTVLVAIGWYPAGVVLAVVPMFLADRVLARWAREAPGGGSGPIRRLIGLGAMGLLLAVGGAGGHYALESAGQGAVAGLATPAGRPPDRRSRPWTEQQVRDLAHRQQTGAPYRPH